MTMIGPENGQTQQIDCGSFGTSTVRPAQSVTVIVSAADCPLCAAQPQRIAAVRQSASKADRILLFIVFFS